MDSSTNRRQRCWHLCADGHQCGTPTAVEGLPCATHAARLVACPVCHAPGGSPCTAPRTHKPRIDRGMSTERTELDRRHRHAVQAQWRIRNALDAEQPVTDGDIVAALHM